MDWKQIKPQHYHVEPVEHICITNLVKLNDYDRLYENQNNLQQKKKISNKTDKFFYKELRDLKKYLLINKR